MNAETMTDSKMYCLPYSANKYVSNVRKEKKKGEKKKFN